MSDEPLEQIVLFSSTVSKTFLPNIDNHKLINEINSSSVQMPQEKKSEKYHTYYEDVLFPYGEPESEKLLTTIGKIINSHVSPLRLILSEAWTLTLSYGQSVSMHSHKSNSMKHLNEYFSIAYYPCVPEDSADLIFSVTAYNSIDSLIYIKPQTGMLLFWNSYIPHMTNRHMNPSMDRVVISANFVPENPSEGGFQYWDIYARPNKG